MSAAQRKQEAAGQGGLAGTRPVTSPSYSNTQVAQVAPLAVAEPVEAKAKPETEEQKRLKRLAEGRGSTYTNALGDSSSASLAVRSLLG